MTERISGTCSRRCWTARPPRRSSPKRDPYGTRYHIARATLDVVLQDLNLPDGKAWDLITDLRGANPRVAVMVLCARFDGANLARTNQADADAILD